MTDTFMPHLKEIGDTVSMGADDKVKLVADGTTHDLEVRDNANALAHIDIADATDATHAVTKAQLDAAVSPSNTGDYITVTATPGTFDTSVTVPDTVFVKEVRATVTTAYDGTSPMLKLGTSSTSTDNLDNGTGVNLTKAGTHIIPIGNVPGENAAIRATLSGTDITVGAVKVEIVWAADN